MSVIDILTNLGSAMGLTDFHIPLGGGLYVTFYQFSAFVAFLFLVWFVARFVRFLVVRIKRLF